MEMDRPEIGRWEMRALLATLAVFAVTGSVQAQATSQFFPTGSRPSMAFGATGPVVNTPISPSLSVAPFQAPAGGGFVQSFFRTLTLGAWPPTVASSPFPPPSAFPSTHYPNIIQPRPPIMSTVPTP
jgi:hypothetical protein